MKDDGKAKKIGFSYHRNAKLLDEILTKYPEVDVVQLQINYLDWNDEDRIDAYWGSKKRWEALPERLSDAKERAGTTARGPKLIHSLRRFGRLSMGMMK